MKTNEQDRLIYLAKQASSLLGLNGSLISLETNELEYRGINEEKSDQLTYLSISFAVIALLINIGIAVYEYQEEKRDNPNSNAFLSARDVLIGRLISIGTAFFIVRSVLRPDDETGIERTVNPQLGI